ncbi:MAG: phenylalanine--tRNA ligase subunit beta [Planctomycetota bacterium]|jgi:phenylalanyl-tRNA synthetase beta chain
MKVSLNWLSNYIETGLSTEEIAEVLSDLGFPCEGIEYIDDDTVLDVEVTSNRGDCLSLLGIARELAASTGKELKTPEVSPDESDKDITEFAGVEIAEPELCGRYTARVIEGIKIGPSPDWLSKRVEAVGLRSVNNVVDATNYAMIETGQPPHAFDYDKITDGKIIVRKALAGERIVSIDGTTCELNPDMLIIADPKGPVAIAGVMGGLDTEVGEATTTILLEDAYFDPVSIRTTSRKLALPSEAAYRFERIVDIEMIDWASKRTAQLITQVAGGKVVRGVVDIYPKKPAQKDVKLRLSHLRKLLGIEIPPEEVIRILSALNFQPQSKDSIISCSVPSWRSDIYREVDVIEEVARIYGYDKIPTEQKISIEVIPADNRQKLVESIATYLNGCGFYETINVAFVDNTTAELFKEKDAKEHLGVNDVSRKSANLLRQTLIGSLLTVLKTNVNARNLPCRIFEIADTFIPAEKKGVLPVEKTKLSLVCDGNFRDLRGVIEGLIKSFDKDAQTVFVPTNLGWAETGAQILIDGENIGVAGIAGRAVKEKYDFTELAPCAAELDFEMLLVLQRSDIKVKPIPRFPAIQRDLSIIVDENTCWADITDAVKTEAPTELENIQFVGIYRGQGIPTDKKSVTLSLRFRDEDGTLTHETVDNFQTDIVKNLNKCVSADLRTV